jgi:Icc-related predicted phosphoesterase
MKLWIFSDIHLEIAKWTLPNPRPRHDVVIIAGDLITDMRKGVRWIVDNDLTQNGTVPVLYVAGNHEYYRFARDKNLRDAQHLASSYPNLTILQDSRIDIDGIRFVGSTLWTDFCFDGVEYQLAAMWAAEKGMNDYGRIRVAKDNYRKLTPKDTLNEHKVSRKYLSEMLDAPDRPAKMVVVTHHGPSGKSCDYRRYGNSLLNGAYYSHMDHMVDKATLWVHGHTHSCCDYQIGDCRVLGNMRGYDGYEQTGFRPDLVVEV